MEPTELRICSSHFTEDSFVFLKDGKKRLRGDHFKWKDESIVGNQSVGAPSDDHLVGSFMNLLSLIVPYLAFFFAVNKDWKFFSSVEESVFSIYLEEFGRNGKIILKQLVVNTRKKFFVTIKGKRRLIHVNGIDNRNIIKKWSDLKHVLEALVLADETALLDNDEIINNCANDLRNLDIKDDPVKIHRRNLLVDQVLNLFKSSKQRRYSVDTILAGFRLKNVSTACYNTMRKMFSLPGHEKLRRLTVGFDSMDNEKYFDRIAQHLTQHQKVVSLMIDEIYVKEGTHYKNGHIHGFAETSKENDPAAFARTTCAFMIESLFGPMKEVVRLLPINSIDADTLRTAVIDVITFLQAKGFTVVIVSADNNRLNQKLFSLLTSGDDAMHWEWFPNPNRVNGDKVFVNFDAVHLFKNIRNNWVNLHDEFKTFLYPNWQTIHDTNDKEIRQAKFSQVQSLYRAQSNLCLSTCFKLSYQAVHPAGFDRQKVYLVDQVFDPTTIGALKAMGYNETADFEEIVRKWWEVMNQKSKHVGDRTRQENKKPFTRESIDTDERLQFLEKMTLWLDRWAKDPRTAKHRLTNDTYQALRQSTVVTPQFIRFLFDKFNPKYFLTAKMQTDQLERRFGKYRTLAGSQYKISMVQLMEVEKKLRDRRVVRWELSEEHVTEYVNVEALDEYVDFFISSTEPKLPMKQKHEPDILSPFRGITDEDFGEEHPVHPDALNHVAGACIRAVKRKVYKVGDCEECPKLFTNGEQGSFDGSVWQRHVQRGALYIPNEFASSLVHFAMIVAMELSTNIRYSVEFLKSTQQNKIIAGIVHEFVGVVDELTCPSCEKPFDWHLKVFIASLSNTVLSGMAKLFQKRNDLKLELDRKKSQETQHTREVKKLQKQSLCRKVLNSQQLSVSSSHQLSLSSQLRSSQESLLSINSNMSGVSIQESSDIEMGDQTQSSKRSLITSQEPLPNYHHRPAPPRYNTRKFNTIARR